MFSAGGRAFRPAIQGDVRSRGRFGCALSDKEVTAGGKNFAITVAMAVHYVLGGSVYSN